MPTLATQSSSIHDVEATMQERWENLHTQARFRPRYPHELVVRWALTQFDLSKKAKILDLGCGGGRHSIFLAREGFETYACDLSREGVKATQNWAKSLNLNIETQVNPAHSIDYKENFFDGVLSYAVLYYSRKNEIVTALDKIYKSLKKGGKFLFVTRGDKDWRINYGIHLTPHEVHLTNLENGTPADSEKDMVQTFLDKDELKRLMAAFKDVTIDALTLSWADGQFLDHDWIVSATK